MSTAATDPADRAEVLGWRKAERRRLIELRLAMSVDRRGGQARQIADRLDDLVGELAGRVVSAYWPFRGEPDLRPFLERVRASGGRAALPVVVEKGRPLVFREWRQGGRLIPGVWNIPVPADGGEVSPDVVIAPVVGFDPLCYRLGYGGGFFDRTLAATPRKPLVLGVGYSCAAIPTIRPLPHDIPMDAVVTEARVHTPDPASAPAAGS